MKDIIYKLLTETITDGELNIFKEWIKDPKNKIVFDKYVQDYHDINLTLLDTNVATAYDKIQKTIATKTIEKPVRRLIPKWFKYGIAALLVIGSLTIVNNINTEYSEKQLVIKNGTDKAVLTLEDGSEVFLEKGNNYTSANATSNGEKLLYNTSKEITKKIKYNYLTVPRGGQHFIQLNDGTKVWLNSESQLKYPIAFIEGKTRKVELIYGEAYFDVSSSTLHKGSKFRVVNKNQEVEVLGTEFNIKAYKDEDKIYTTLIEGKVAINNATSEKLLQPNQQSVIQVDKKEINIISVNTKDVISWKNGVFSFKEKTLKDIMITLSRWYNVNIVFENKELETKKFNGVLNKKMSIEKILSIIKQSNTNLKYTIGAYDITIE